MRHSGVLAVTGKYLRAAGGGRPGGYLRGAALGICLALIPLVVVLVVTNGMILGITERYVELGSYHLQLRSFRMPDEDEVRVISDSVAGIDSVTRVVPVIQGTGLIYSKGGKTGVSIRAIPPDEFFQDPAFRRYLIIEDGALDITGEGSILLSTGTAAALDVKSGDDVVLLTARTETGRTPVLRPTRLRVTGVFSSGYRQLDSMTVYIPLEKGRRLFGDEGNGFIGLKTSDPFKDIESTARSVENTVPVNWYVYTWYQIDRSLYKSLQSTKLLLLFIMGIIVVVAVANISSATTMLVLENLPEIAIMKSFGASPQSITLIFLFGALVVGCAGTALGVAGGLLIGIQVNEIIGIIESAAIWINRTLRLLARPFGNLPEMHYQVLNPDYYLEEIPISLPFRELAAVAVFAVVLSVIAAYLPAVRAGKVRPLTILRKH